MLSNILTNNITELNELIYAEVKLVCEKNGIFSKSTKNKAKSGWEIRLETQIKNIGKHGLLMVGRVLWHINLCRLFNAKSIFMQIISSISNNSI